MPLASDRRSTPISPGLPGVLFAAVAALAVVACQPTPSGPPPLPSGGPATFRPTPTPVPGSSETPSEAPASGNVPNPSIQVPPPIP